MKKEDEEYDLPDEVAEQLLCSSCNLYLSCGPVETGRNGNSLCGRCSPLNSDNTYTQSILFEKSMSKFRFPCSFKAQGCNQRILFGYSFEHERVCPYRTFLCPSLPKNNCMKSISGVDIYEHFQEDHKDLVLSNGQFKLDWRKDSESNFLMQFEEIGVIVQYRHDSSKRELFLNVAYLSKIIQHELYYKLEIINGLDLDSAVRCKELPSRPYELPRLSAYNSNIFKIDMYLTVINNPVFVIIKVVLTGNVQKDMSNAVDPATDTRLEEQREESTSWYPLEKYRCDLCYDISYPPVFTFDNPSIPVLRNFSLDSESIFCYECKSESQKLNSSATVVEINIAELDFPCRWRGCSFVGNKTNIRSHIGECQFKMYSCPIELCEKGFYMKNDMIDHMKQHGRYFSDSKDMVIDFSSHNDNDTTYFTVWKTILVAFICYKKPEEDRKIRISCNQYNIKFDVKLYFVHDHCLFRSEVFIYTDFQTVDLRSCEKKFPSCFRDVRSVKGVINISDVNNSC